MDVEVSYAYREADVSPLPIEELCRYVLSREGCPACTLVSVSFVDDDAIARLNGEYRGKEGPTDVLSFECDSPDDEDALAAAEAGVPLELGDVIVAVDVAERQTRTFGTTLEGEITQLVVHGLLHLCGYDHIEDAEAELMEAREAELLGDWAEERGLDVSIFGQVNEGFARIRGAH